MKTHCSLLLLLIFAIPAFPADLQQQLDKMARQHRGKVALYAINMKTGDTATIDPDTPVATASVIKLPVLVEAFAQVKSGKRSLEDKVTLDKDNQVPGSGILTFLHPGLDLTLRDALVLMIDLSDNTATNLVIDQVTVTAVNARMTAMGLKNTYLYKKVYKAAQGQLPPDYKKFGLGKTTAREMGEVMESIVGCAEGSAAPPRAPVNWNGIADPVLCREMIDIMRNQQYRNMIPHYLETVDTTEAPSAIADKIGQLDDVRNDVAVVFTRSGPIVMSAFTYDNKDQVWNADNEAELLIAHMAKKIVDSWAHGQLVTGY